MRYAITFLILTFAIVGACLLRGLNADETKIRAKPLSSNPRIEVHIQAPPVPLTELVRDANRIFVGSVTRIEPIRPDAPELRDVSVEEVSFVVQKTLKGTVEKTLKIRQAASIGIFREKAGPLLIYLSPNSAVGLTQPIGIYSGYFKVHPDPEHKGRLLATNLHGNEGLWGEAKCLIGDARGMKIALQSEISQLKFSTAEKARLVEAAGRSERPRSLPLELLLVATHVLVRQGEARD